MQDRRVERAKFDLELTADRIRIEQDMMVWGERKAEGAYRVHSQDGNRVVLLMDIEGWDKGRLVLTVQGDRLRFGLGGRSMILKRRS